MRKFLSIVLIICICSISILSFADNLQDLQNQYNETQEQIQDANDQLEMVQSELTDNLQQVQKLDETITSTEDELTQLNTKIDNMNSSIEEISTKLATVEEQYNKQKDALDARLVAIYEAGDIEYLDVLLKSNGVSDFISSYFLITELASYDSDLLETISNELQTIETSKQQLEEQKQQLQISKQTQLKTSKVLQNAKSLRESLMSRLSEQELELQSKIDQYKQDFSSIEAEILLLAQANSSSEYIGGTFGWPVPGYTRISSYYGMRTHPITGVYKLHTGIDISGAPIGTNFIAAADGTVVKAGFNTAYGNMVIIDHGGGIQTLYAHGSEIMVEIGQTVKKGDVVLKVGSTGYSTGPHAHFEIRINGTPVDPLIYLSSYVSTTNTSSSENTIPEQ